MNADSNSPSPSPGAAGGFDLRKVLLALFAHKWKIIIFSLLGLGAAGYVYLTHPRMFECEAKLLVRYVVDRSSDPKAEAVGYYKDNILGAEMEILTSWDLALKVAESLTPKKLLPENPTASNAEAALEVRKYTTITSSRGSNVILAAYRSKDPELAGLVLRELVAQYFEKHLEVHRSAGTFDIVTQQTDQLRSRLSQTEEELNRLKNQAGVISLAGNAASLDAQMIRVKAELYAVTAERLGQEAFIVEMQKQIAGELPSDQKEIPPVSPEEAQRYQTLCDSIETLRTKLLDLQTKFTNDSRTVQLVRDQITELEAQRKSMVREKPGLAVIRTGDSNRSGDALMSERARFAQIQAREKATTEQLDALKKQAESFAAVETQIAQLERRRQLEEKNYINFESSLEKARIDEALDPTKMPNISVVQQPSPPMRIVGDAKKLVLALAIGGIVLGLLSALVFGLLLDGSIKRPYELEELLRIPVLLSVPFLAPRRKRPIRETRERADAPGTFSPVESPEHPEMRHFYDAIRDRLTLYFELNQMRQRPKLLGITGCTRGVGVSTLANGLATSLSETGGGRVLLVNTGAEAEVNGRHPEGQAPRPLAQVIDRNQPEPSSEKNLILASACTPEGDLPAELLPNRFYDLVPALRASNFNYIIFDLPPLDESSVTLALAGAMDHTILVVEAGRSHPNFVRRAFRELTSARAKVSGVLNKTRTYGPGWMTANT